MLYFCMKNAPPGTRLSGYSLKCKQFNVNTENMEQCRKAYHFIVYFVEMNFTDFIYDVFALKCDEAKSWKEKRKQ